MIVRNNGFPTEMSIYGIGGVTVEVKRGLRKGLPKFEAISREEALLLPSKDNLF